MGPAVATVWRLEGSCEPQHQGGSRPNGGGWWLREPCELLAPFRFLLEGGADRSGVIPGTPPRLAPEEPLEALSWAKVSLASLTRPHGGWSRKALLAGPPSPPRIGKQPDGYRYQALKVRGTHCLQAPWQMGQLQASMAGGRGECRVETLSGWGS